MSTTNEQGLQSDRVRYPPGVDLDEFRCSICLNILWKPVACQSCENPFCSACISKRFETYPGQCPMQCDIYTERLCPPFIIRQLAKLQIDCIYRPNGCKEVYSFQCFHYFICIFTLGCLIQGTREARNTMWLPASTMYRLSTTNLEKGFFWTRSSMPIDWIDMCWLQTYVQTMWRLSMSHGHTMFRRTTQATSTRIRREQTTVECNSRAFV
jgi:hypothetical protein